jgi:hypothetical protein
MTCLLYWFMELENLTLRYDCNEIKQKSFDERVVAAREILNLFESSFVAYNLCGKELPSKSGATYALRVAAELAKEGDLLGNHNQRDSEIMGRVNDLAINYNSLASNGNKINFLYIPNGEFNKTEFYIVGGNKK